MKKKELEKKIKEKCKELDLVEEEKKKIKKKDRKYWIIGGVLIVFLIAFLIINSLDPTRVYDKNNKLLEKEVISPINEELSNSSIDLFGLNGLVDSSSMIGLITIILVVSILFILLGVLVPLIFPKKERGLGNL